MTLNITVVSPTGVHQSSDFRLTDFRPGPDGRLVPIEDNSPKLITLQYRTWAGYLTYCGIGKWDNIPTYDSAGEWIVELGPDATFDQVAAELGARGSVWIQRIQQRLNRFVGHTFILAGFDEGRPRTAIISNTHSTKGGIPRVASAGLGVTLGGDKGVHVYVTGIDNAVLREDRLALKKLAVLEAEPNVIRHKLAQINKIASQRIQASNGISESCMCYSLDPLGGGSGEIAGRVQGRLVPINISRGRDTTKDIASLLGGSTFGPSAQLKGISFTTSVASNAAGAEQINCTLDLAATDAMIVGQDLSEMNERHVEIAAANGNLTLVGQLRLPVASPPQAFRWLHGEQIEQLPGLGGSMCNARDVNSANEVVGACSTESGEWRAVLWRADRSLVVLGTLDANNSAANALNDECIVVGSINQSPAPPGGLYERAFMWSQLGGMRLVPGTEQRWSRASDINSRGDVLLWAHDERGETATFVWSTPNGLQVISDGSGRPFYGSCINDSGVVVGEADDNSGTRRAMIWTAGDGLRWLNLPFEFHPSAIDLEGNIVGFELAKPWTRAWLVTADEKVIPIPAPSDHNIDARAIVPGAIFGHARKGGWKHVHPIRWDFGSRLRVPLL